MEYFLPVITIYIGLVISKYYFTSIAPLKSTFRELTLFIFIPFSSFFVEFYSSVKYKKESVLVKVSELMAFMGFSIYSVGLVFMFLEKDFAFYEIVSFSIFSLFLTSALLYFAVYDLIHFAIPENIIKKVLFITVIVELLTALTKFFFYRFKGEEIFNNILIGDIKNVIGGAILAGLFYLLVSSSKEKFMGAGDIDMAAIAGIAIGWPNIVIFFLSTVILGALIGSIYGLIYKGTIRNVLIPFVPFIFLGLTVTLGFGEALNDIFFKGII